MKQNISLTKEELALLKALDKDANTIIKEFGNINISQLELDKRKDNALKYYEALKKKKSEVSIALQNKYGRGNIDIVTGIFTPAG